MRIVREAYPWLMGCLALILVSGTLYLVYGNGYLPVLGTILLIFALGTVFFFRNPKREVPKGESLLVAPADGRVLQIISVDDEFVGAAHRIDIFLSVMDVHINRVPCSGVIEFVHRQSGRYLAAFKQAASERNARTDIGITGINGKFRVAQITGAIARRIICRLQPLEAVQMGQPYGMICFGSRTEVTFPKRYAPQVRVGQRVVGGETVIGSLTDA